MLLISPAPQSSWPLRAPPNDIFCRLVERPSPSSSCAAAADVAPFFFFLSPFSVVKLPVGVAAWLGVLVALLGESESRMYETELREKIRSLSLMTALRRPAPTPPPAALPEIVPPAELAVADTADALM